MLASLWRWPELPLQRPRLAYRRAPNRAALFRRPQIFMNKTGRLGIFGAFKSAPIVPHWPYRQPAPQYLVRRSGAPSSPTAVMPSTSTHRRRHQRVFSANSVRRVRSVSSSICRDTAMRRARGQHHTPPMSHQRSLVRLITLRRTGNLHQHRIAIFDTIFNRRARVASGSKACFALKGTFVKSISTKRRGVRQHAQHAPNKSVRPWRFRPPPCPKAQPAWIPKHVFNLRQPLVNLIKISCAIIFHSSAENNP